MLKNWRFMQESLTARDSIIFGCYAQISKLAFRGSVAELKYHYLFHFQSLLNFDSLISASSSITNCRIKSAEKKKRPGMLSRYNPLSVFEGEFPSEVKVKIFNYLDLRDLFNLALVNSFLCNFCLNPSNNLALWRPLREIHGYPLPPRDMCKRD
ncbi:hypothetical protein PM082_009150 [Marasmius tenuissimus]|nr:hypothetical protein PM082_009150 [Marasmius tenuissimus]